MRLEPLGHSTGQYTLRHLAAGVLCLCVVLTFIRRPLVNFWELGYCDAFLYGIWTGLAWIPWLLYLIDDYPCFSHACPVAASSGFLLGLVVSAIIAGGLIGATIDTARMVSGAD